MTTLDAQFVDRIVREVVRRIAEQSAPANGSSPDTASKADTAEPATPPPTPNTLVVDERLITLAKVQDRLAGIQQVIIRGDAVVTPSVRDLLREKKVRIEQRDGTGGSSIVRGLLAVCNDANRARDLATALSADGLQWQTFGDVNALIRQLQQTASRQPTIGLAVTPAWAHFVCQANRHNSIRAVAPADAAALDQACKQLNINLLILDSNRLDRGQILDLGRMYLRRCLSTLGKK
jgi:pyruvate/2-oxoglutarate dehydrogenase complex dihydrolipoamide acyltransferase (E2) component